MTSVTRSLLFVSALFSIGTVALAQNIPPTATLKLSKSEVAPGGIVDALVTLEFAPGLHGYQNPPTKDYMIPVVVKSGSGATVESVKYPAGNVEMVAGEMAAVYSNSVTFPIKLKVGETLGEVPVSITVSFQQCDASACFAPSSVSATATVTVKKSQTPATGNPQPGSVKPEKTAPEPEKVATQVAAPDSTDTKTTSEVVPQTADVEPISGPTAQPPTPSTEEGLLGWLNGALEKENWGLIIPLSILVGLALCLTPCVFPMIPVTVSFFSNQKGADKSTRAFLGISYALGIALTYGAVGGASAALGGVVGSLFTKPWFAFSLAALLIALALSMFDVYEIRLPGFLQKQLKGRSGTVGALIMGLLMGFAAAPCAGALVGAVAVKVAEIGSVPLGIGMFGLVGLGMGLPFMALATVSSGAKALPKSGGWLKTVKAVLGFVVLSIAFGYLFQAIGLKPDAKNTQLAWIVVYAGFAAYLFFFDHSGTTKAITVIKGVTGIALGFLAGTSFSAMNTEEVAQLKWIPYTEQSLAAAAASGKPIVIDGRADWCLQCREIEEKVFNTPGGTKALSDVALLAIDWSTGVDQKYIDETKKRFNITGLPNIVFMKPGGKVEFTVKQLGSVDELKEHLKRAGADL